MSGRRDSSRSQGRPDRQNQRGKPRRQGTGGRGPRSSQAPRERSRRADPARLAAWEALRAVEKEDAYANLVLPPLLRARNIRGRDAAFATELTYGTLRLKGRYDAIIAAVSSRGLDRLDAPLLDALRIGAHQIFGMRVPDHAAVSATVALVRQEVGAGPAQFANAILRSVSRQGLDEWLTHLTAGLTDHTEELALRTSHPGWIVRAFRQALAAGGQDSATLPEALEADNLPPEVHLVLRPGVAEASDAPDTEPGRWAPTARILPGGDPHTMPAVRDARVGVQDEGSQLLTLVAAAAEVSGSDDHWLDLCAGPGGKTALWGAVLAERAPQGVLLANEISPHRTKLVEGSVAAVRERLPGLSVRTGDGREAGADHPEAFDRVLVDAPCTGLGALRRRPEARWRRTPADLSELGTLQRELLTSALRATRPGGVVTYITCSPHLAETRLVVEDVLRSTGMGSTEDTPALAAQVAGTTVPAQNGPYLQLWPHLHGTDAMFGAVIRRH